MTNSEIADKLHQLAMELADLAEIAQIKGQEELFTQYTQQAYVLERQAAMRLQTESDENEWKYLFLKSAGWLAYQLGWYQAALQLAELGLNGNAKGIALYRLQELKESATEKMELLSNQGVSQEYETVEDSESIGDLLEELIKINEVLKIHQNQANLDISRTQILELRKEFTNELNRLLSTYELQIVEAA